MCSCVSYRVTFAGLELEVVCFVKHWVLLHEQLLVELLYYLRERQKEIVNPVSRGENLAILESIVTSVNPRRPQPPLPMKEQTTNVL